LKKDLRILFTPSDIGGGFGHISRCMALAQYARNTRKYDCAFIVHRKGYERNIPAGFKTYFLPISSGLYKKLRYLEHILFRKPAVPLFIMISNLNYQVIRDGFADRRIITKTVAQYKKVIQKFKPDVIIGDTNLIIGIAAGLLNIPLIQLVRAASYPKNPHTIWWEEVPDELKPPKIQSVFNPVLEQLGLSSINQAEDLLRGDLYLIPSIPQIEPVDLDSMTHYIGPLLVSRETAALPAYFENFSKNHPVVYITIGGGASTVGNQQFFETVINTFQNKKLQIIVSTSIKFSRNMFRNVPSNIHFEQWIPGREMIKQSELIIFHGGYGTMMETIEAGKPSIVIPFHSEQESNGRRLESLGCSLVCKLSEAREQLVRHQWKYGEFTTLVQTSYDLTSEKLFHLTNKILKSNYFKDNAKKLKYECSKYGGAEQAFEIINRIL
jgi:uncharacterized protein (TIGR00661 family)